jgi:hypothetical protein
MKLIGYIDGQRRFIRDEVTPRDVKFIALKIKELADFHKKRLVLFLQDEDLIHMIQPANGESK